jgi:hypothetical protein
MSDEDYTQDKYCINMLTHVVRNDGELVPSEKLTHEPIYHCIDNLYDDEVRTFTQAFLRAVDNDPEPTYYIHCEFYRPYEKMVGKPICVHLTASTLETALQAIEEHINLGYKVTFYKCGGWNE